MANPENLKPFKPGQSGNPGGRPKGSSIASALHAKMVELDPESGLTNAQKAAVVIVREALAGDFRFMDMLLNRVDGKVVESLVVNGDVNRDLTAEALERNRKRERNRSRSGDSGPTGEM